jgi:hypothetical protein
VTVQHRRAWRARADRLLANGFCSTTSGRLASCLAHSRGTHKESRRSSLPGSPPSRADRRDGWGALEISSRAPSPLRSRDQGRARKGPRKPKTIRQTQPSMRIGGRGGWGPRPDFPCEKCFPDGSCWRGRSAWSQIKGRAGSAGGRRLALSHPTLALPFARENEETFPRPSFSPLHPALSLPLLPTHPSNPFTRLLTEVAGLQAATGLPFLIETNETSAFHRRALGLALLPRSRVLRSPSPSPLPSSCLSFGV